MIEGLVPYTAKAPRLPAVEPDESIPETFSPSTPPPPASQPTQNSSTTVGQRARARARVRGSRSSPGKSPDAGPVDRLGVECPDPRLQIMPLSAGTCLGHYDVTALLGEGGMGQVWQATDTQLGPGSAGGTNGGH